MISPAPLPAEDGDGRGLPVTQQAAGEDRSDAPQASAPPPSPAAPEADDEPVLVEADVSTDPEQVTIPEGANAGLTLGQVAEKGSDGESWLRWASQNPQSESVGSEVHAALQHFRPQLFQTEV